MTTLQEFEEWLADQHPELSICEFDTEALQQALDAGESFDHIVIDLREEYEEEE